MKTKLLTWIPGMTLAVLLTLLVGQDLVFGHDDDSREPRKLEGTWDVTLSFPKETCDRPECGACPGGGPKIPLPTLNTFLKHGGMLWSGSALFVGPGQGSWERLGHNHFMARFKFFTFDTSTLRRTGMEELTKDIRLTGPDTFEATTTYDFLDAAGTTTIGTGCIINESAKRFE
jgi:hypothetical protein